ncbi:TPA: hypothetical protein N6Y42_005185, partial [Escherichia coli]|nr:hypothetical protein [Escherichia coli]
MNKIYAIKKNKKGEAVVVSEVSEGIRKSVTSRLSLNILLMIGLWLLCSASSWSSVTTNYIPYQTYRDFAENKGLFKPGTVNFSFYDKQGNVVTSLSKAP